ncbi:hypothetical protein G6K86_30845 [Agrobacterium rhizogenes]|nr:hypothetical protein [Rhizobium rhizogenes]
MAEVAGTSRLEMSRVKSRGTSLEMIVRCLLHPMGCQYQLRGKSLPGEVRPLISGRKMLSCIVISV